LIVFSASASGQITMLPLSPAWWAPAAPMTHEPLSLALAAAASGPAALADAKVTTALAGYLATLAEGGPTSDRAFFPEEADALVYFVNAHIAWTLALSSEARLADAGVATLRVTPFPLARGMMTLSQLVGEVWRRAPHEPRLVLFLNPGWKGGPPLPLSALEGHSLSWQLNEHARRCGAAPGFWTLDRARGTLALSAVADLMWALPADAAGRFRAVLDLVPPPGDVREAIRDTCGPSLQRCRLTITPLDQARLLQPPRAASGRS
jgi:hypothetical protein